MDKQIAAQIGGTNDESLSAAPIQVASPCSSKRAELLLLTSKL